MGEKEKREEENEKKIEEQAAKEREAKRKAEQDQKDRQPGHCRILNSAGGGTFTLLETGMGKGNMKLRRSLLNLRGKFIGQALGGFAQQAIGGLLNNPSNDPKYKEEKQKYSANVKQYKAQKKQRKEAVKQ